MRISRLAVLILVVGLVAAAIAVWLFPRALPIVALEQALTRQVALARADSFFRHHSLAPAGARTAVQFHGNDSLRTFVELAGGGPDSLNALVRGDDVAPFVWSVRAFVPNNPREARVDFAPDGRIIGFERKLAEADPRPTISADSGQRLAQVTLDTWIDDRVDRWKLVSSSYETKKASARIDRTYTFERMDRRIGGAPIRTEVVIAGNTPSRVRPFVEVPESFRRRYAEMRSANEQIALIALIGILAIAIVGVIALTRFARQRSVRWREPMAVGVVIGVFALAAFINEIPGSWFWYDTAMSPGTFRAMYMVFGVLAGASTAFVVAFTLAAAEASTRRAFPGHLDWWKLWRYRGTSDVAYQVGGGYAVAAIALAYVTVFYLLTRMLFGWWVPSELLDDPNLIASPMPWVSGIAISLNAAVWEEALFRALPLSLLSLWVGRRPTRKWWMAAGVIASALIFGFAHANYASWPPYSRGVEIFLDAVFWAVLFLQFGLLLTIVAHFAYDLVLFGIFATAGSAVEYRITAAIILVALLSPALVVAWKWIRQRNLPPAPEEARFGSWRAVAVEEPASISTPPRQAGVFTTRSRRVAMAAAVVGIVLALGLPPRAPLGRPFTAERERAVQTADSMLVARGGNPAQWKRLTGIGRDTLGPWPRFLRRHDLIPEAQRLASTYAPPTWWTVRYVRTMGTAAERAEEWRMRVWPDGKPLDARHLIPDSAARGGADTTTIRGLGLAALARDGIDTSTLVETELRQTARPARRDTRITYTDTAVKLPDGAAARVWVDVGGDDLLLARREVELPETFLRADRAQQTNRAVIGGVAMLVLLASVITGAILAKRRRPILVDDGRLDRKSTWSLVGILVVLTVLGSLNGLPTELFAYDTAQPWARFVSTTLLALVATIPLALVALGLWFAVDAMRRRAGIPMLSGEPSRSTSNDMLIAGLGIAGIVYAITPLNALALRGGFPRTPTTVLNDVVPALSGVPHILMNTIMAVALIGLPLLVIAALADRWAVRADFREGSQPMTALGVISLLALIGVVAWSVNPDADPLGAALALASLGFVGVAVVVWGTLSAWSWIVAALAYQALNGLRGAAYGAVWQDRVASALTVLAAGFLIALIARRARTPARPPQAEVKDP